MAESNTQADRKKMRIAVVVIGLVIGGIAVKKFFFKGAFTYAGTLEATKVTLSAQVPSTIAEVKVQEGAHVQRGEILVSLSCEDIKINHDLAVENYERTLRLFKSGSAARETLDQIKNKKDELGVRISWCSVTSPIQGTVLSRYHEPGEWVSPGTQLMTLANIRDIWATIYVPEPVMAALKTGMTLTGVVPEMGNQEFQGKIVKISDEAEFTPKNVQTRAERERLVFGVKVSFLGANEDEALKPGMTIELSLPES